MKKSIVVILFILGFLLVFLISGIITFSFILDDSAETTQPTDERYIAPVGNLLQENVEITRVIPGLSASETVISYDVYEAIIEETVSESLLDTDEPDLNVEKKTETETKKEEPKKTEVETKKEETKKTETETKKEETKKTETETKKEETKKTEAETKKEETKKTETETKKEEPKKTETETKKEEPEKAETAEKPVEIKKDEPAVEEPKKDEPAKEVIEVEKKPDLNPNVQVSDSGL